MVAHKSKLFRRFLNISLTITYFIIYTVNMETTHHPACLDLLVRNFSTIVQICLMLFLLQHKFSASNNESIHSQLYVVFKGKLRFISRVPSATHLPLQQFEKAIKSPLWCDLCWYGIHYKSTLDRGSMHVFLSPLTWLSSALLSGKLISSSRWQRK